MRLVFLGPPGAGKGTLAKIIAKKDGLPHISTGDLLRANIQAKTDLGKEASQYMDKGELVPDRLVVEMVQKRIAEADAENGFILDGFPRTEPQAKALKEMLRSAGKDLDRVVNFDASDETIIIRLSGRRICSGCGEIYHTKNIPPKAEGICDRCGKQLIQRKDDEEATVRNRLEVYRRQTAPLIEFYRKEGLLENIPADKDVKELEALVQNLVS
ncbi:MAG TPA: adenylate kinase [Candidatus Omnitrophota bacterium]|nr:adenylate kinase [Candidatus Omnitrophota bacterium]